MLKLEVIGNLGQDPEMRYTPDGDSVTTFSLACDVGKEKVQWVRVSAWRKLGELANEYLAKGSKVFVRGRARISEYTAQDGTGRYSLECTADELVFLSSRPKGEEDRKIEAESETVAGARSE